MSYILILGGSNDPQLQSVVDSIAARGAPVVFLDHKHLSQFSISFSETGEITFRHGGRALGQPAAVWCRLKIRTLLSRWTEDTAPEYLRRAEWKGTLLGLALAMGDRFVGPKWEAEYKVYQMATAIRVGFKVPASAAVFGREAALAFAQDEPDLVTKPIDVKNYPNLGERIDSYTLLTPVPTSEPELRAAEDREFQACPLFLQRRVRHGAEYRVLAFRGEAFTYKVRSRIEDRLRVEDRAIHLHVYDLVATPPALEHRTTRYLEATNLDYGAFDFLVEDDDEFLFLECNPEGQWDAANGINAEELAAHFADVLIRRAGITTRAPSANALQSFVEVLHGA